ncbi:hypothetical protein [Mongoliitalea daihaiensis]|uniref:hypothetical protein n=1 Tax=Mongoliitalea daihaiensis TaxID=2782006 RepID=UPI001F458BA9|nr:hypothetical protein [Mongoliitalea daihaiensis]UJP65040.1 hypothetical protein IPZ59_20065 [Mongoliitalea daihaiensis]
MITCKPKTNTYVALGSVLGLLIIGLIATLAHFANVGTFGLWFYLISTSLLTIVILLLMVKMMAGYKFISAGKEKITLRFPLRKATKIYNLDQVSVWEEEKVVANKKEFKQLTIVFDDQTSFSISNHEHDNYQDMIGYFQKKIARKNISNMVKTGRPKKK